MWFMTEDKAKCDVGESEELFKTQNSEVSFIDAFSTSASDIVDRFFTTGCSAIDQFLKGGIPCFGITEIFGIAGSAKTQLCLQLAITAQLPEKLGGLNAKVLYISTEHSFASSRFVELSLSFQKKYQDCFQSNLMDNVTVENAADSETLVQLLRVRAPVLLTQQKVRLVILDSVAAVFRGDYEIDEMSERALDLRQVGSLLLSLGSEYGAAVVVVNQATTLLDTGAVGPALGHIWSHFVTTRIQLGREGDNRSLTPVQTNHLAPRSISIELSSSGIECKNSNPMGWPDSNEMKL